MSEPILTSQDISALTALANAIIPADARDIGAASVGAGPAIAERIRQGVLARIYVDGLKTADDLARTICDRSVIELTPQQLHELIAALRDQSPAFFRQLRADVCARYLSDPDVWQRIGFPGASSEHGGHPDFDQRPA
jgi:hypothetical protein